MEPSTADLVSHLADAAFNSQLNARARFVSIRRRFREPVAPEGETSMRRVDPREGDERLSAKQGGKSAGAGKSGSRRPSNHPKKRQRTADLGRALRTVYDDTLRETVPDEFIDLLGKLS